MRVRHVFGIATLALLLAACSAEPLTGPSLDAPEAAANVGAGWAGGGGRTDAP
jgi:hypothetical protein